MRTEFKPFLKVPKEVLDLELAKILAVGKFRKSYQIQRAIRIYKVLNTFYKDKTALTRLQKFIKNEN